MIHQVIWPSPGTLAGSSPALVLESGTLFFSQNPETSPISPYYWFNKTKGSRNLPHIHATYLFTSISHSPYSTLCPPPLPPPSPSTTSSPTSPPPPHQTTSIVKYVRAHLTNTICSSVTYVTQDCIWTAFSHLTTIPHELWKCPLCLPRHLLPLPATLHLRLPSPILDFDSD